jgi:periplasmic divalent cation tolerance protein
MAKATTDPATTNQAVNDSTDQLPLVLALTTEASAELAERLARSLLERRLVACVSLQPSRALYRWQGAIAEAQEVQVLLKTDADHLEALHRAVLELHSYDTPEWIWWQASSAGAYADWLRDSLERIGP